MTKKAVVVFSGGLDSTTLAYYVRSQGYDLHLVSFDYGQRHSKELVYAAKTALVLDARHDIVDLSSITPLLAAGGSSLVSGTDVPEGHYAADNMKATVVPNRNMIMLSIAGGIAVAENAEMVATGVHAGDHFIYPDCRPRFINAANAAIVLGNSGFGSIPETLEGYKPMRFISTPFIDMTKAQIAFTALELGVHFEDTWSCYKGGDRHCGKCGTCVERLEAISQAVEMYVEEGGQLTHWPDLTDYEDRNYWKTALKEGV
jgi:7-cyano-7-deazaguanine synthase